MIEFSWELQQIPCGIHRGLIEKQTTFLLRPHDGIWGKATNNFVRLAEDIFQSLTSEQMRHQFLSVCLGSYLLNPQKTPKSASDWIQGQKSITEIIGCDVTLEEIKSWRWDRAAFPVLYKHESGWNSTIYYALVATYKTEIHPLHPAWVPDVMNPDAQEAVTIAAALAQKSHPEQKFFFWPFINPKKPVHDRSLGLPVYLSFLSLANGKKIPLAIATGEIDRNGTLHPVHGVFDKCNKAFKKEYKKFIYPDDGSSLEKCREQKPIGVTTLFEAECQWGVRKKATVIDDKEKASLIRHIQTICSAVLGSDNLPYALISAFDTKHEEAPSHITATHEYIVIVDIAKVKYPIPQVREAFASFLGKEIHCSKTEMTNWLYWGEGEKLTA